MPPSTSPLPPYVPNPAAPPPPAPFIKPPSAKQQSVGTVISIVVIVLMIVIGAFYAWGKRIAEQRSLEEAASSTSAY